VTPAPGDIVRKRGQATQYRLDGFFDHCSFISHAIVVMARMRPLVSDTGFISTVSCPASELEVVRPNP